MNQVKSIVKAWRTVRHETPDGQPADLGPETCGKPGRVGFESWFSPSHPIDQPVTHDGPCHGTKPPWTKTSD